MLFSICPRLLTIFKIYPIWQKISTQTTKQNWMIFLTLYPKRKSKLVCIPYNMDHISPSKYQRTTRYHSIVDFQFCCSQSELVLWICYKNNFRLTARISSQVRDGQTEWTIRWATQLWNCFPDAFPICKDWFLVYCQYFNLK